MGIKNFNNFAKEKKLYKKRKWEIGYKNEFKENKKMNKNDDLGLIIDGNCLFYYIGGKIPYFPLDYNTYLKKIQKV